ncbi:MAG: hypothetical protein LHW64_02690 [Candidatus Cloacimonetes bacterium]|nr:hypothetical protein [Candidatus Cloacimonadota bacterium]MCB5286696.1 hypothetical protein [Candidatus Cloacimonadota bacterium]MCK9184778.1 hypothetical protein [Candidatus Cloacimonadota bacterium]MDY0229016.1 hypothetical protein [Candidatus Cloacimonadaceae bacterium]
MRIRWMILLVLVLIALMACEQDILKPSIYTPDNANQAPLFITTGLLSADGSFTTGYRNYNIRADRINLSWKAATDDNFLCYKLLRDNIPIRTFDKINQTIFTDSLLSSDRRYLYTIATVVNTGMNKVDTLGVKTASIASPIVYSRINQDNSIKIMWQDRSDIPGEFELYADGTLLATIPEYTGSKADHIYSYLHSAAQQYVSYDYTVQKKGLYSDSYSESHSVYNSYIMSPPILSGHQSSGELSVNLWWDDDCTSQTAYWVYRRILDSSQDFQRIAMLNSPIQSTYTDSENLQYGSTYQYAVKAVDAESSPVVETDYSNTVNISLQESNVLFYDFDDGQMPGNFDSYGYAPWYITSKSGGRNYCIRSGVISDDEYSGVEIELQIPNYVSVTVDFDYYVSSEDYYDGLYFYCNYDWYGGWSGNTGWQHFTHSYTHYGYDLSFEYQKDGSGSSGMDCAMIDNLSISYIENGKTKYVTLGGE